ncbi:hypothetical protein [Lacticaseibacillus paracasei]|uniref:hypothetical protein n=1 Tax=Lacticaseibacillus paracasei TaxID=1597 RepID=UPI001C026062|nr:hypothetical protein [Lacticaseibacillus paracasei]MBT9262339.1 hypothetical protein [Lacticaseibacillus paracasei]
MKKSLIIWVPSYSSFDTMKFNDVSQLKETADDVSFNYNGLSTREKRKAIFQKSKLIGWALSTEDEK